MGDRKNNNEGEDIMGFLDFLFGKKKKHKKHKKHHSDSFPAPLYQDSFTYAYDCAAKLREEGDEAGAKRWEDAVKPFRGFGRND